MLVLTPKYGSQLDLDLLKKQKEQKKDSLIKHRLTIDLNQCEDIKDAYLAFLNKKDKYVISYKPKDSLEINKFVKSLGEIDTLDVSWINISDLKSLIWCFNNCKVKHIVGLEKWDVSNVGDMSSMFSICENLESVDDISEWDVSNVKTMNCMFFDCVKLKSIDLSKWGVSSVEDMGGMFDLCKNLVSIGDISGWDVSNATWILGMFEECEKLKSLGDLEQWNLPVNTDTKNMFENSGIKQLPSWYYE